MASSPKKYSSDFKVKVVLEALDRALQAARPEIFNTDQGVQFTSKDFTDRLLQAQIRMSWDGRGRALDNVFVERLWRSVTILLPKSDHEPEIANGLAMKTLQGELSAHWWLPLEPISYVGDFDAMGDMLNGSSLEGGLYHPTDVNCFTVELAALRTMTQELASLFDYHACRRCRLVIV